MGHCLKLIIVCAVKICCLLALQSCCTLPLSSQPLRARLDLAWLAIMYAKPIVVAITFDHNSSH